MTSPLPNRRTVLAGLGASAGALPCGVLPARAAGEAKPLWQAAASCGILFGTAGGRETLETPQYGELQSQQAKIFAFENALKFGWIRPKDNVPDYSFAETLLGFAEKRGMLAQGTALIWNEWVPDWYKRLNAREATRVMEEHLDQLAARFYGRFHSYSVINEPFWPGHGNPGGYRSGPFFAAMGEDHIFRAFKRVAAVDPTTKLILNETYCELGDKVGAGVRACMLTLIDKMQDKGIKLDGVGLETHLEPREAWDGEAYARFLEEIAKRKLKIHLTEFDVNDERLAREPAKRDEQIAEFAATFLKIALANKAVEVFIAWGLVDRYSWHRDPDYARMRKRSFDSRSLLFDDNYREKPITRTLASAFRAAPNRP
jgi:endo-1,4-beta-xylanase